MSIEEEIGITKKDEKLLLEFCPGADIDDLYELMELKRYKTSTLKPLLKHTVENKY